MIILLNGKVIEYYNNGKIKYDGNWVNGLQEGFGTFYFEDSSYITGQWKKGLPNVKITYYSENKNIIFEGNFIMLDKKVMEYIIIKMENIMKEN